MDIPGMNSTKGIGKGNIAIGIVGFLVAILGVCAGKLKNACFAIPYGIFTFIFSVVFLIMAIISFGFSTP